MEAIEFTASFPWLSFHGRVVLHVVLLGLVMSMKNSSMSPLVNYVRVDAQLLAKTQVRVD